MVEAFCGMSAIADAVEDARIGDCFRILTAFDVARESASEGRRRFVSWELVLPPFSPPGFDHRIDEKHNIHTPAGVKLLAMALGNCRGGGVIFWEATCSSWVRTLKRESDHLSLSCADALPPNGRSGMDLQRIHRTVEGWSV
jgi:hypothetical protein